MYNTAENNEKYIRCMSSACSNPARDNEFFVVLCSSVSDYYKGLFTWAEVISVAEKTFRQVYKRDLALFHNNMKNYIAFI